MANYAAALSRATTSTTLAAGVVYCAGSSMRRIHIHYLSYSSSTAPADSNFLITVSRSTTAPTATSVTPTPTNPADVACVTLAAHTATVNGTVTASTVMLSTSLNQKATFQWYAPPGSPDRRIIVPATANNGVHILTPTTSATAQLDITCHFDE
jgi:hypothetical protein